MLYILHIAYCVGGACKKVLFNDNFTKVTVHQRVYVVSVLQKMYTKLYQDQAIVTYCTPLNDAILIIVRVTGNCW